MAETPTQNQPSALPDPQAAYNHLVREIYEPVLFHKLAGYGIAAKNAAEARDLCILAGKLRSVSEQQPAGDGAGSYYAKAASDLDLVASRYGLDGGIKQAREINRDLAAQEAAANAMQAPSIYNSVLSLKAAEAQATVSA